MTSGSGGGSVVGEEGEACQRPSVRLWCSRMPRVRFQGIVRVRPETRGAEEHDPVEAQQCPSSAIPPLYPSDMIERGARPRTKGIRSRRKWENSEVAYDRVEHCIKSRSSSLGAQSAIQGSDQLQTLEGISDLVRNSGNTTVPHSQPRTETTPLMEESRQR